MQKPEVGDEVSVLVPGRWERRGVVVQTDYHPLGVDDAVLIRFSGEIARGPEWWDARYVWRAQGEG